MERSRKGGRKIGLILPEEIMINLSKTEESERKRVGIIIRKTKSERVMKGKRKFKPHRCDRTGEKPYCELGRWMNVDHSAAA